MRARRSASSRTGRNQHLGPCWSQKTGRRVANIYFLMAGLQERKTYFLMASIKYTSLQCRTTWSALRGQQHARSMASRTASGLPTGRPRVRVLLLAAMKVPRSARAPVIFRDINAPQQTSASTYLGSEIVDDTSLNRSVTRSPITRSMTLMA